MITGQRPDYLISIEEANVSREGKRILFGISWRLRQGENWAVVGANGSGKSTFLKLIRGNLWPEPNKVSKRVYCLEGECQEAPLGVRKLIGLVDPELQDSYVRSGIDIPGEEVVLTGFFDSVWLQERPSPRMMRTARHLISLLDLDGLRKRSILTMSRGEARKILIARSLVSNPRVLLMDEVFNGLDARSGKQLFGLLERTIEMDTQLVLATHRTSDLGPFITHVALLKGGRIFRQGRRDKVLTPAGLRMVLDLPIKSRAFRRAAAPHAVTAVKPPANKRTLVKMQDVDVYIDGQSVLSGITWEMKAGENWAVMGKNGAGKSTFLRLISGKRRPAFGGKIGWFDGKSSGSVWDLRKKIGHVSPELQAEYDEDITGLEVVLSGLFSSIGLYMRATAGQKRNAGELLRFLGIENLGPKRAGRMSYGEFRKVLIARALIKKPALLLLDEPFSGLDRPSKRDLAQFLDKISRRSIGVILVTHHRDEIISSISHILVFDHGRIAARGLKHDILQDEALSALHLQ